MLIMVSIGCWLVNSAQTFINMEVERLNISEMLWIRRRLSIDSYKFCEFGV